MPAFAYMKQTSVVEHRSIRGAAARTTVLIVCLYDVARNMILPPYYDKRMMK